MKVVLTVIVVMVAWELVSRTTASSIGRDRAHIAGFADIAKDLHKQDSPRVLFLGNSLTEAGVDLAVIERELSAAGLGKVNMARVVPVGTDVLDWIYISQTYFTEPARMPEVIVVGFAAHHVQDAPVKRNRRLGRYFVSPRNIGQLFSRDMPKLDDRAEILLSMYSSAVGDRPLMQEAILAAIIPYFHAGT